MCDRVYWTIRTVRLSVLYAARALHAIVRESPAVNARPIDELRSSSTTRGENAGFAAAIQQPTTTTAYRYGPSIGKSQYTLHTEYQHRSNIGMQTGYLISWWVLVKLFTACVVRRAGTAWPEYTAHSIFGADTIRFRTISHGRQTHSHSHRWVM